jgi:hypothetical protein
VITNALGSRSVSLREMMRRATAAVRSSGNKSVFVNFCVCSILRNKAYGKIICFRTLLVSQQNIRFSFIS